MQKNFTVSVILPVYNSEKFIARCLRSLSRQSINKNNYEIIVINDCSTDKSLIEIHKFKQQNLKIINNEKNLGLAKSLHIGIRNAKGSLVIRVDSDDWVHEDFLNIMSTFLFINENLDAVACDYVLTDENEKSIKILNCEKNL